MKKIYIFNVLMVFSLMLNAQVSNTDTLFLYSKYTDKGVKLKIIPQLAQTWLLGAEKGYTITRTESGGKKVVLNKDPLLPYSKEECSVFENGDSLAEFNQTAIYDHIEKNKREMTAFERIGFVEKLQNDYGFYILLATRIPEIGISSGLEFTDETAEKGKTYFYEVKIAGDNHPSRLANCFVNAEKNEVLLPELDAIGNDHTASLSWMHQGVTEPILYYYVEKSEDGSNFERISYPIYYSPEDRFEESHSNNKAKVIYKEDSLVENYKTYFYRLVGVDVWAEEYISDDKVMVVGEDQRPPHPVDVLNVDLDKVSKKITYSWDYEEPADFAGFRFFSSDRINGKYKPLNEGISIKDIRSFTIDNAKENEAVFFMVVAYDTSGNYAPSEPKIAMLPDLYPPSVPTGFNARIDTNGCVTLYWNANPENDIKGYRIFASNSKKDKGASLEGLLIKDTFYLDTINLKTLSKFKYFQLEAVDYNINGSGRTAYITVKLPDQQAPSPSQFREIDKTPNGLMLTWSKSLSMDVKNYVIYRKKVTQKNWYLVAEVSSDKNSYKEVDELVGNYEYKLQVVDSSGNKSAFSETILVKVQAKDKQIIFSEIKAKKKDEGVEVSWKTENEKDGYYVVFRKEKSGDFVAIGSVKEHSFLDKNVKKGNTYKYTVFPQQASGVSYIKDKEVKVVF
jgi:fibronectin type 3 domain-containing protein